MKKFPIIWGTIVVVYIIVLVSIINVVGVQSEVSSSYSKSTSYNGNEMWMKTYGGWRRDDGASVEQTTDGGYIIVGRTQSYGAGGSDIWLIKTDSDGNKIWDKTFGGKYDDWSESVQQTDDDGFIILGMKHYNPYDTPNYGDIWLIKTDDDGNEIWNKTFDSGIVEEGVSVLQTDDGGFLILGNAYTSNFSYICVYLIKTDSNGNMIWDKKFEGKTTTWFSIAETSDHCYVGGGGFDRDAWVFKTNSTGELIWEKTYGGSRGDNSLSLILTNDDNIIVVGETLSYGAGGSDIWLLKINSSGDLLQNITIGRKYSDEKGYSIKTTNDGGYIIAGVKTWSFLRWHRSDGLLVKLDSNLVTEWMKTFGGFGNDGFLSVQQIPDTSYIIAGFTTKFFNENVWLVKTN